MEATFLQIPIYVSSLWLTVKITRWRHERRIMRILRRLSEGK